MKLTKLDLSQIVAIAHQEGHLQLLLDRGAELEFLTIPAPVEAYEGLQQLHDIIADVSDLPRYEEGIAMQPILSSMANSLGYDSNEKILQVEFCNGAVYQYSGVDEKTWEDMYTSDSVGIFFNQEIKGKYASVRVDDEYDD
ncbi:KTSC domain-containing protein [Calothrix sp. 336/3]|uniref:KTSC domain-containing protein n=1 Tax=Calothrix sp. 336/3 TaxID=1337936 RepID=UPI0004E34BA6|nr:KTSC domain-containing protein [Calothrix sp. 336/3]AKG19936.1 hypothetical protein IJ00_00130 [Calothrix sp. 336/3]